MVKGVGGLVRRETGPEAHYLFGKKGWMNVPVGATAHKIRFSFIRKGDLEPFSTPDENPDSWKGVLVSNEITVQRLEK